MRRSAPVSINAALRAIGTPATLKFDPGMPAKASDVAGLISPNAYCQATEARGISTTASFALTSGTCGAEVYQAISWIIVSFGFFAGAR